MSSNNILLNLTIPSSDTLICILGKKEKNLNVIAKEFDVEINSRGNDIFISGLKSNCDKAERVIRHLESICTGNNLVTSSELNEILNAVNTDSIEHYRRYKAHIITTDIKGRPIKPKSLNQLNLVESIENNDITFGIGPAGSGKTFLAVACAVKELLANNIEKIILARPLVESGEKLGFLPGSETEKIQPYLSPLLGYLEEIIKPELLAKYFVLNRIQLKSLALMRGSDFKDSFIILDESQNTKTEQMKMFLTRLSHGSKMVITGDISQTDLSKNIKNGLTEVQEILKDIEGIGFVYLDSNDVFRHPLVKKIIEAYENKL